MTTLVLSTRNAHKIGEIQAILGDGFRYLALDDFTGPPTVVEDADTFEGNAARKSEELARWIAGTEAAASTVQTSDPRRSGATFVLADDSGLEVDALNGAPGVHSARFAALDSRAATNSPDHANNAKLLRLLADVPEASRTARFRCVIALTSILAPVVGPAGKTGPDTRRQETRLFKGACEGRILSAGSGDRGFGYDPLFVPSGFAQTFAELGDTIKNRISHRSQALRQLSEALHPAVPTR